MIRHIKSAGKGALIWAAIFGLLFFILGICSLLDQALPSRGELGLDSPTKSAKKTQTATTDLHSHGQKIIEAINQSELSRLESLIHYGNLSSKTVEGVEASYRQEASLTRMLSKAIDQRLTTDLADATCTLVEVRRDSTPQTIFRLHFDEQIDYLIIDWSENKWSTDRWKATDLKFLSTGQSISVTMIPVLSAIIKKFDKPIWGESREMTPHQKALLAHAKDLGAIQRLLLAENYIEAAAKFETLPATLQNDHHGRLLQFHILWGNDSPQTESHIQELRAHYPEDDPFIALNLWPY
ncbi:MAG: hypothetical protein AAF226_17190 [Verrucomicrobiota bacterium]